MSAGRLLAACGIAICVALAAAACTQQAEQGLEVSGLAEDVNVQSDLRQASVAANLYLAENGSLDGFDSAAASGVEPSLDWSDGGPAAEGQISIRGASGGTVALVSRSTSGTVYCLGVQEPEPSLGKVDAQSAAECTGGW